ncbi:9038_t:CDS:2 [Diversispora eburnea]|uniref:9038_t:CDS:1 n=1 Tax=Diversispora eburnea TaxID=1213867 RepID=A0A9N9C8A7_9GLOM|nr:9038_t:CDS:2 [Diversispora eburnea]
MAVAIKIFDFSLRERGVHYCWICDERSRKLKESVSENVLNDEQDWTKVLNRIIPDEGQSVTQKPFSSYNFQKVKDLFGLTVDCYLNLSCIEIKTLEISEDVRNHAFGQSTVQAHASMQPDTKKRVEWLITKVKSEELPINKKLLNHVDLIEPVKELFKQIKWIFD